jgi:hypothetical protein
MTQSPLKKVRYSHLASISFATMPGVNPVLGRWDFQYETRTCKPSQCIQKAPVDVQLVKWSDKMWVGPLQEPTTWIIVGPLPAHSSKCGNWNFDHVDKSKERTTYRYIQLLVSRFGLPVNHSGAKVMKPGGEPRVSLILGTCCIPTTVKKTHMPAPWTASRSFM